MSIFLLVILTIIVLLHFNREAVKAWMMRRAIRKMQRMMGVPDPAEEERRRRKEQRAQEERREAERRNATFIRRHIHITVTMMKSVATDVEYTELNVCRIILPEDNITPEDQISDASFKLI